MRILITNLSVAQNSGSESVVELLADGLRGAGHQTMLLTTNLGGMADRMRQRGHHVVDRIAEIVDKPDIIHGQHLTPCLTALARFPDVPAVFSCHSSFYEIEAPMPHPQIRHWIAVDEACKAKCLSRGIPADKIDLIYNAVDLERFRQRPPLPARPKRGLLLTKNFEHQQAVREACARNGIQLDELGPATNRYSQQIEKDLLAYDIVFATARMAIEAAAVGCSVVVCDARGFAGMLDTGNMESWRRANLGVGLLSRPVTIENLTAAISSYNAENAAAVSAYFRDKAGSTHFIDEHLRIYNEVLRAGLRATPEEVALGTASWIEEIAVSIQHRKWFRVAKEMHGWPDAIDQLMMMELLRANTKTLEGNSALLTALGQRAVGSIQDGPENQAILHQIDDRLSRLSRFVDELSRLYNGMVPLFIRKMLLRIRRRG
ncbi:glycosyltransferase [Mesorhizobium sp. VK23B]|uniref:Glycosyltransferase n=1 Tax=Mesorhizobium dulcispinae TaxID=3072316 RepID=A0ABU4X9Q3_9HYPH|nr:MULTISPECIES: glycosyltransferase [unclassified Mesorhizobium]MDX8464485.1 glycosyltransferase [Mesorhizobium sp. VK23B]MDX8470871.1 glycosyltransferase [Mesorhizobium sp. VK23A]